MYSTPSIKNAAAVALQDYEFPEELLPERLPFTVRIVRHADDLAKAVAIRSSAYGRHLPEFAETLKRPEATDAAPGVVVFLAASRVDGSPLGTMRIQTNLHQPLALEQSVELPPHLRVLRLAEATRLGITQDRVGQLVKTALFKSFYQYCASNRIDWMVIAGRSPIDRQYERLLFRDVYPDRGFIPLKHAGDLPHRVMSLEVAAVQPMWHAAAHPLYDFFFLTHHPDLETEQQPPARGHRYQPSVASPHAPALP